MTYKWYVNVTPKAVTIRRTENDDLVATLNPAFREIAAKELAQRIVDDWNFNCDEELEAR